MKTTTAIIYGSQRVDFIKDENKELTGMKVYDQPACIVHFYGDDEKDFSKEFKTNHDDNKNNPHRFLLQQGFKIIAKDVYILERE